MIHLPKLITVERHGSHARVLVDGEEFPYAIAEGGLRIEGVGRNDMPAVTVTLVADRVEVTNDARAEAPEVPQP